MVPTDWIPVSITVNHNACLGEIYIAIPRQLVDTKKTFGRLYLTVFYRAGPQTPDRPYVLKMSTLS